MYTCPCLFFKKETEIGQKLAHLVLQGVVGWGWAEPSKFTPASLIVLLGGACHQA